MKNFLMAALFIGLLLSLWFNWKHSKNSLPETRYKTIDLGNDSLKLIFNLVNPISFTGQKPANLPPPSQVQAYTTMQTLQCTESRSCVYLIDGVQTPPLTILPDPELRATYSELQNVLKKFKLSIEVIPSIRVTGK